MAILATKPSDPAQLSPKLSILVIDDDPVYRETARMFLGMHGRSVILAENGRKGLEAAAAQSIDLIVVDLEMPDMNGLEVIAQLRRNPVNAEIPIIMVTSRDDAMAIDRAFELGAASFVVKPVNWTLLDHYVRFVHRAARNEAIARKARAEAEALARSKDGLLFVIRHELKTPLNAIIGFTKLAEQASLGRDVSALKAHIDMVVASGSRLLASMSDMALYSDLISGRGEPQWEMVSPDWVIDDALDLAAPKLAASGLAVNHLRAPDLPKIRVDVAMLAAALQRLIENAVVHAKDATRITLRARLSAEGLVELLVQDEGAGMQSVKVTQILQPFTQADPSLARPDEGLGLGLPIVAALIAGLNGNLAIDTAPGEGMRVTLAFPRAE